MATDTEQSNFLETLCTAKVSQQVSHIYISYFCVLQSAIMKTRQLPHASKVYEKGILGTQVLTQFQHLVNAVGHLERAKKGAGLNYEVNTSILYWEGYASMCTQIEGGRYSSLCKFGYSPYTHTWRSQQTDA